MKIFDDSVYIDILRNRLTDPFSLAKARIHPLNLLMTWKTYSSGHGQKGQLAWNVKSRVKYILEDAFYLLFKSLDEVLREINGMNFGATDCALPMIYARERKIPADAFIVYTDNETWRGKTHPFQALK
ncbi:MAG: hypothetical protein FWE49_02345, partial [Synergistaceae bacterium]|nr:hypothetical protein [Synergistaceae bacterium]